MSEVIGPHRRRFAARRGGYMAVLPGEYRGARVHYTLDCRHLTGGDRVIELSVWIEANGVQRVYSSYTDAYYKARSCATCARFLAEESKDELSV